METETTPVVIGAVELINNGYKKHMEEFPGAISLNVLNNILIKNSAHTGKGSVLKKQDLLSLLCHKTMVWTLPFRRTAKIQEFKQQ